MMLNFTPTDDYPIRPYVEPDWSGPLFHEDCGYLWKLHDNRIAGRALPFGCPSEAEARAAWGDR